jgi:orotidine-5'-phosphate decarboxylase
MSYHWGNTTAEIARSKGNLVLGIDPVITDIPRTFYENGATPDEVVKAYLDLLLAAAKPKIGFIKFQSAFFEALGTAGIQALAYGIGLARTAGLAIILDAKRGDIGSTAQAYARAYLDPTSGSDLEVDCLTVNPFLGPDTLEPFLESAHAYGKGLFVLVKTSNPGSTWLQGLEVGGESVSTRLARYVDSAGRASIGSSGLSNIGAVVGATYAAEGQALRLLMPSAVLLAPGVGAQGACATDLKPLHRPEGGGVLVPVSRGITKAPDLSIGRDAYADLIIKRISEFQEQLK